MNPITILLAIISSFTLYPSVNYAQNIEKNDSIYYKELLDIISKGNNNQRFNNIKNFVESEDLKNLQISTESIDWFGLYKNIIIEKKGTSDSVIYIICHYDKVDANILYSLNMVFNGFFDIGLSYITFSKGAYDNGSGILISLSLLKWINNIETKYTYKFLFAGMEEYGLRGSRRYVSGLKQEDWLKSICAINIDMVAHKSSNGIVVTENVSDSNLIFIAESICLENNYSLVKSTLPKGASGDYKPFSKQSLYKDFSTSFMCNSIGAFIPQKSYFTKSKKAIPIINFTDCFKLTASEYLSIVSPISFGKIHSFRDKEEIVSINNLLLYTAFFQKFIEKLEH